MPDPIGNEYGNPESPAPKIIKGATIGKQAERLVKARREITRVDEMTRLEKIEAAARVEGEKILASARTEAGRIIDQAKSEADGIRSKARQDGDIAAKSEALAKLSGLITELDKICCDLRSARNDFLNGNLEGIIRFSVSLARKVIIAEIRADPDKIAERVCTLMARMPCDAKLKITVSPSELDIVQRFLQETKISSDAILPALQSDPSVSRGSVKIESDKGTIDAGLLESLEKLGNILAEQARHQSLNPIYQEPQNGG
ncbi:MAG: FliH/SctL family protein [bacterium]